jgi:GT2 family glycosyltransferase
MVAFGVAVSDPATLEAVALPGIERASEPDSVVITRVGHDSIQRPYNEMLEEAARLPDLEALVLLHQDLELTDASLIPRIRQLLREPEVGVVGAIGWAPPRPAADVGAPLPRPGLGPLALWSYAASRPEDVFGRLGPLYSEGSFEVEMADGILLALAPWVVRSIRFDERMARDFHGYDVDFSLRVRAAGGRIVCDDIPCVHHMSRLWRDRDELVRARTGVLQRWHPSLWPPEWAPAFET